MPPLSCSIHHASPRGSHVLVCVTHTAVRSPSCCQKAKAPLPVFFCPILCSSYYLVGFITFFFFFFFNFPCIFLFLLFCSCCCNLLLACFVGCCLLAFRCFDLIMETFVSEFVLVSLFSAIPSLDYNNAFSTSTFF
jgi:hypothetical protein